MKQKATTPETPIAPEGTDDLPVAVQEALGVLAVKAKDGLLSLSVGVGLGVVRELIAAEVEELRRTRGKRSPGRRPGCASAEGSDTVGGQCADVEHPCTCMGGEQEVLSASTEYLASRDPITDVVLARILSGVGCVGDARGDENVEKRSAS